MPARRGVWNENGTPYVRVRVACCAARAACRAVGRVACVRARGSLTNDVKPYTVQDRSFSHERRAELGDTTVVTTFGVDDATYATRKFYIFDLAALCGSHV